MFVPKVYGFRSLLCCAFLMLLCAFILQAQSNGGLHGKIVDPLGNPVPDAKIVLLQDEKEIVRGKSDTQGAFELAVPSSGRYTPRVEAAGFTTQTLPPIFVTAARTRNYRYRCGSAHCRSRLWSPPRELPFRKRK